MNKNKCPKCDVEMLPESKPSIGEFDGYFIKQRFIKCPECGRTEQRSEASGIKPK